ncbi:MAG: secretion protein HlyD [Pseudomonadota bacterium]
MNRKVIIPVALIAGAGAWFAFGLDRTGAQDGPLMLYGNVDIREVDLAFRVGGRLESLAFEEGDAVTAGDALAGLDAEPFEQSLAVADAQVRQAASNLDKLRAGFRPQEIRRSAARVDEATADRDNALAEVERLRDLISDGATSQRDLDAATARNDAAEARLASALEDLALLEEGFRSEDIAAAEAQLALAEAQADEARTRLADTALLAPSDGTIISRVRERGAILGPGEAVFTLSLDTPVEVRAYVDEPNLGSVRPGMQVSIGTDSSDERFPGQVGFISPRAEFTPRTVETEALRTDLVYRLRIIVEDPDGFLRQGMPVTVDFGQDG